MPADLSLALIFPHQLYQDHPALQFVRSVCLVEEYLFFSQYHFHKRKLALHRASMQEYAAELREKGFTLRYVEATESLHDIRLLLPELAREGVQDLRIAGVTDDWLEKRLKEGAAANGLTITWYPTPNYLTPLQQGHAFFDGRKRYYMADFYQWQRKRMQVLINHEATPVGGKWSFDEANRERLPRHHVPPVVKWPAPNDYAREAIHWVEKHFTNNPGELNPDFHFPTTRKEALQWFAHFLDERFYLFGPYEDAIAAGSHVLYHSVLTPMLNTGLLQPDEVVQSATAFAAANNIPLNSLEGFVRQIIGWREFVRMVYVREHVQQRTKNFWGFERRLPRMLAYGESGIFPFDNVVKKTLQSGYAHHIERLMVLGNFFLLCEIHPDDVYRWFMELYIDAYDWVMVPNTYGMTQSADGGLMTTKPYISGSNYLMKMSDYPKGDWQTIWDGLFWRFMHVHRDILKQNQRLGMLIKNWDKMDAAKQAAHLTHAETFLARLDANEPAWQY